MPMEIEGSKALRCDNCGKLITGKPLSFKPCCVNKPKNFCSRQCFMKWRSEWLRNQEQIKRTGKAIF